MNIYTGLLFNLGHVQDPALALSLAGHAQDAATPTGQAEPAGEPAADPPGDEDVHGDGPDAAPHPRLRRGRGWVELQAALLSAFR